MSVKRAFVAGATGLTGRHLVSALTRLGMDVFAHVRPDSPRRDHWQKTFEEQGAQCSFAPWEPQSIHDTVKVIKPQVVFGCLGTTRRRAAAGGGDYTAVDYGLTAMLIDAACQLEPLPLFVYLSAVGVSENSKTAYMKARADVESYLAQSRLHSLIVRPSFIIGSRDDKRPGEAVGARLSDGALAALGCFGLAKVVGPYRTVTGQMLAEGMAMLTMDGADDTRIVRVPEIKEAHRRFVDAQSMPHPSE